VIPPKNAFQKYEKKNIEIQVGAMKRDRLGVKIGLFGINRCAFLMRLF
jgi:hypothetical protein